MADNIGTGKDELKTLSDRQRILTAIQTHLDRGCFVIAKDGHKEFCPYYDIEVPCETQIFLDVYDLLSPKPVSNVRSDGMYYYGSCPSCGMALHHNSTRSFRFCTSCGTALQWPTASATNEVPPSFP